MHLIDGHRAFFGVLLLAGGHPQGVLPVVMGDIRHDGGGVRAQLGLVGIGVGLEENVPLLGLNGKLIEGILTETGDKEIIDPGLRQKLHLVLARSPAVEIAHDAD